MQATVVPASAKPRRRPRTASRALRPGTGCRRTWRGRCAGRSGRSSPGRPPGAGAASAASRSSSNSCAARTRGSPPRGAARLPAGCRSGSFSARFGNSLTPVIASRAVASRCAGVPGRGDPVATRPESSAADQAAGPLDLGEPVPRRLRERVGQRLDVPGAARPGRARGPGAPPRPAGSGCSGRSGGRTSPAGQRGVERLHGDDVGAAHARGEAGDRRPQQVDPGVALRRHHRRGDGVLPLRRGPRARRR